MKKQMFYRVPDKLDAPGCPHAISLGAGVQSSALALMAARGIVAPMPQAAIFADTHAEPRGVYDWLAKLETLLPFPVVRVSNGDLRAAALEIRTAATSGRRYLRTNVPAHLYRPGQNRPTIAQRHCTGVFKIQKIMAELARIRMKHHSRGIVEWLGISTDEIHRMKPSKRKRVQNAFPLVELGWSRADCLDFLRDAGFPSVPRSACTFCAFRSGREWAEMREHDPESFEDACRFEEELQAGYLSTGRTSVFPCLAKSGRVPLRQYIGDHAGGWGNECGGRCGV